MMKKQKKFRFKKTQIFKDWLDALKDEDVKDCIDRRIRRAEDGNFGKGRVNIAEGVSEMKINYGPGYRLYYCQRGKTIYLLLTGGDKSTQQNDVKLAKAIKIRVERGEKC